MPESNVKTIKFRYTYTSMYIDTTIKKLPVSPMRSEYATKKNYLSGVFI